MGERISIHIGLLAFQPCWQILLDQIGVSWSVVDLASAGLSRKYSLLIANKSVAPHELALLNDYIERGGAVLHTPSNRTIIEAKAISKKYLGSIPPQNGPSYRSHSIFDLYDTCLFFDGGEFLASERKGRGIVSYLGVEVDRLFANRKTKRKNFYGETARLPNEIVAKVSKATMRQFLTSHIEYLHHQRNIPFVHKWYYPNGAQSIFAFRIDSDKGTQEQIEELFQLSEHYRIPTTWFLDVKSHEAWLPYFKKFTSQEIGIHCYEHVVHKNTALNEENFSTARTKLAGIADSINGISAPTGAWNENLQAAFENLKIDYSSEFGFDYDNFPSFPWINGRFSPVVQIPIHPVCVGTMRRAGMSSEEMFRFFKTQIDGKLALNEPVCLYHHPTHGCNGVFETVFQYINEQNVPKMSFSDYSQWWRHRLSVRYDISFDGKNVFNGSENGGAVWLKITDPSGKTAVTRADSEIPLADLNFYESNFPGTERDVMRARRFDPVHVVQNFLDWWVKVTE